MTGLVSNRWTGVAALAAPMSVVALVFILQGFPWAGLAWASLAFSAVLWGTLVPIVKARVQPSRAAFPGAGPWK
jgi:hypothetical protein